MSWLTDTLTTTGILIAFVLVARRPVARLFGPGLAYSLWALPLLRLALPPLMLPAQPIPTRAATIPLTVEIDPIPSAGASAPAWTLTEALQAVWLAGALLFIAWRVLSYRSMRRSLLVEARPVGETDGVRLVETPAVASPVAFGVVDKVVALPPGFMDRFDRAGRDLAIAHELEHHAGRDLAVNFAMQPLLALHWFNPVAWAGWRALRRDQEAACDARVLAGCDGTARAAYGRLIAGFARGPQLALAAPMACPVLGEKSIIHRLRSLTMSQPSPRRRLFGRALIAAGVLALPLTASVTYAASTVAEPPAPPAAPEAPEAPEAPTPPEAPLPPEAPQGPGQIVIVEHSGKGDARDAKMHTRTVTRDGKTIVIKTDQPLSDAELEAKLAEVEKNAAEAEAKGRAAEAAGRSIERQMFVLNGVGPHPAAAQSVSFSCGNGSELSKVEALSNEGGKPQKVMIRFCGQHEAMAQAIEGIRMARSRIEADDRMPADIKQQVLKQLQAEIDRLSREG